MPPTKEVQQDDAHKRDPDKEHDTTDGASKTQPVKSAEDIVRNSLERAAGGGQQGDAPALSDAILAPPGGNFKWNAQRMAIEANLAEGKTTVSNMSFTVKDSKGHEREITGPSSYNTHGQQFIIDQATMQRYRVIPPADDGGSAVLRPVGRRGGSEQMTVLEQKNVEPYANRGSTGARTGDGGTAAPRTADPVVPKTSDQVVKDKPGATTAVATANDTTAADTGVKTPKPGADPVVPAAATTNVPAVRTEVAAPAPSVVAKPAEGAPLHTPVVPADAARGRNYNSNDGGDDRTGGNRWRAGENADRYEAARQIREAVMHAQPPLSQDQLRDIRDQFRQDPVKALQQVYQIERQMGGNDQRPIQTQPDQRPGAQQGDPRIGQQGDPRLGQQGDPRIGQPTDPRLGGVPQVFERPGNQIDPRQIIAQLGNDGRPIVVQPGQGQPGQPGHPIDRGQIDPRTGMPPQIGERPVVPPPVVPGDRAGGPLVINPSDLGRLQVPGGQPPQGPARPVELVLVDAMKNPQLRPALVEFLQNLQQGKLPTEQQLQQNKQLTDVIRMIGPEGLNDIRRALIEKDPLAVKPAGGDGKTDAGISPRLRDVLELITTSTTNPRNLDLLSQQNSGATVSERLLAILKENEKGVQRIPDGDATKANLIELGKLIKDMNTAQGLEPGKGLTMRDVIGRSLEEGRPLAQQLPEGQRREFIVRPQGPEDLVVKALLDKIVPTREGERPLGELNVRTETMTARLEPKTLDIKIDAKIDPNVKIDTKLDTGIVKPETAVKPEGTLKPEDARGARDVGRTDVGQQQIQQGRLPDAEQPGGKQEILQGKLPNDPQNKDKEEESEQLRKLKEKEKKQKEQEDAQAQQDAALLAMMNAKKRKETEDKDKQESSQEKDKKEPEQRQKYIVKPGDTLDLIATRQLRDKRLAGLIFEINKNTIPVEVVNGKKTPKLVERMVIWLPTPTEAKDYRARLMTTQTAKEGEFANAEDELIARFGKNWDGGAGGGGTTGGAALEDMEEAAKTAYQARRKHIESLLGPLSSKSNSDKPKHVVRLGETLKSVAMKHPALEDVTLWKLLAELNGLSSKTDDRGVPIAKLTRGQALILPTAADIEAFRQRETGVRPVEKTNVGFEVPSRSCPACQRVTFASALLCPACGARFDESADVPTAKVNPATKIKTSSQTTHQPELKTPTPAAEESDVYELDRELSDSARLMHCGNPELLASGYKLRLEVRDGDEWVPVIAYEVFTALCLRHEFQPDGQRKTIRIDLPPQAASELAQNDMVTNWSSYETKHRRAKASV